MAAPAQHMSAKTPNNIAALSMDAPAVGRRTMGSKNGSAMSATVMRHMMNGIFFCAGVTSRG